MGEQYVPLPRSTTIEFAYTERVIGVTKKRRFVSQCLKNTNNLK